MVVGCALLPALDLACRYEGSTDGVRSIEGIRAGQAGGAGRDGAMLDRRLLGDGGGAIEWLDVGRVF